MATTTSQVRDVINDLYTLLVARPGLSGVTVFRYAPSPRATDTTRQYLVIAVRVTDGSQEYPGFGTSIKDESFTLNGQVYVQVGGGGDDTAETALMQAEAIAAEIEAALQPDPTLGRNQATDLIQYAGFTHTFGGDDQNRMHLLDFTIDCTVRLVST